MSIKGVFKNFSLYDWLFFLSVFVLIVMGLMVYYSLVAASFGFGGVLSQIFIALLGVALLFWVAGLDYRIFKSGGWLYYVFSVLLLLLVMFLGSSEFGAKRWIDVGFLTFQPVEVVKCFFIIFLARYFAMKGEYITWKDLGESILWVGILVVMVGLQPDLGSAIVLLVIWVGMIFVTNVSRRFLWMLFGGGLLSLPLLWFLLRDYQKNRILTFLDPMRDPYGAGYNVLQSQIAVGSGGWWGLGLGKGLQSQLHFLPVAYSDFAFAVLAEEFGFIGSMLALLFFGVIIAWVWRVAFESVDQFGFYLGVGIGSLLLFQIFINVAMNLGIMPVTGIPLPFISSGGTSFLAVMFLLGLVVSIRIRSMAVSY